MIFAVFVLVAIAYAVAMAQLGRLLRRRGYGSKLDKFGAIYGKALERAKAATVYRLTRQKGSRASSEGSSE